MTTKSKILIIDNDSNLLTILKFNFELEGFDVYVNDNCKDGIEKAKVSTPDLIILDVVMPVMDGFEACTKLRSIPNLKNTLIIFLTANIEDSMQIKGFDCGGDDYIRKPVKLPLLLSRVRALIGRKDKNTKSNPVVALSEISINKERHSVCCNGNEIYIPKKEFELLQLLMSEPDKLFTREAILESIWDKEIGDRTIDVHIRRLREKIGSQHIVTFKGEGYKFVHSRVIF